MDIVLIAAVARNGVIGKDGGMPWHYPEDLEHFKQTTMGAPVIAGRKTHESIVERNGQPLPGRTTVVMTRTGVDDHQHVVEAGSVEAALSAVQETGAEEVFVIGGETIYKQFLDKADRMVLTEIREEYDGDTYFPEWDGEEWIVTERTVREELTFLEYTRD